MTVFFSCSVTCWLLNTGCGLVLVAMETNRNVLSPTRSQLPPVREHKGVYCSQSSSTLPYSRTESSHSASSACPSCALLQESVRESQLQNEALTRSLSHILASLKSAKDLMTSMERSLEKKRSPSPRMTPEPPTHSPLLSPATDDGLLHANIVDSLYPTVDNSLVPELTQAVTEIRSIISEAADMCLVSAGTSFSASVALNRAIRTSSASTPNRRKLSRMQTLPSFYPPPMLSSSHTSSHWSEARNLPEDQMGTPTNCSTTMELMNSDSKCSLRRTYSDTCLDSSGDDFDTLGELMDSRLQQRRHRSEQFHSHFLSLLDKQRRSSDFLNSSLASVVSPEPPLDERKDYVVSLGNGLSGEESKQLLEKIALMENERLKSMTEIEELRDQNALLWDSLTDMSYDVDSKSLHLQLALQDLHAATNEIKKSTELKQRVDELIK